MIENEASNAGNVLEKTAVGRKGRKIPLAPEESLAIFIFNQTIISSFGSGGILDFIPYKPGDGA